MVSEMFKRTISRAGLKEALALRNLRKIEREKEIEKLEKELKPSRGSSISSYFRSAKGSPEERRKVAGIHYAQWEANEETFIRNMAAKVLQQRWRMMRWVKCHLFILWISSSVTLSSLLYRYSQSYFKTLL